MKKIKILHGFLATLLVLFTLSFFAQTYSFKNFEGEFQYSDVIINMGISLIIIIGIFFLQRALHSIIKNGFFNKKAYNNFKNAGLFFLISGFISIIYTITRATRISDYIIELLYSNLGQGFLLIMVGFSLFIFTDVIKNGSLLKQENELTI